jgi:hypothetical protein
MPTLNPVVSVVEVVTPTLLASEDAKGAAVDVDADENDEVDRLEDVNDVDDVAVGVDVLEATVATGRQFPKSG